MEKINAKAMLYILTGIVVIISWLNYVIFWEQINLLFFIDCISKSVLFITVISALFCRYWWKFSLFGGWLVKVPDLNGLWKGTLESDWVDPNTGIGCPLIATTLNINQSLFKISCIMTTNEMKSSSLTCGYNIDKDNQRLQLSYTYLSVPKQNIQERSPMHYGAIIFDIEVEHEDMKLSGNYWNGRKRTGTVDLVKVK